MSLELGPVTISPVHFEEISRLLYRLCGIHLSPGKEGLVVSRLSRRLRALRMSGFDEYLAHLRSDRTGQEIAEMVDVLTTNKTSFFREAEHLDYLREQILPAVRACGRRLRIWSAGCSTGEEPYSIGIVLRETLPDLDRWDVRILATDISARVLAKARAAIYDRETVAGIGPDRLSRYFVGAGESSPRDYQVHPNVRSLVRLARLNLVDEWPMQGPFDVIFCRNVMIYFDQPTRQDLVRRFWELLGAHGYLFIGHSESLTSLSTAFRYMRPAVYVK